MPVRFYDKDDNAIPTRAEVHHEDTWDLTALYRDPAGWSADFATLQTTYPQIAEFRGKVGTSAEALRDALECDKRISRLIEKLYHYSSLRSAEDSSDAANLAREAQLQNLLT